MKTFLIIGMFFSGLGSKAQVENYQYYLKAELGKFQEGYYIDNNGNKNTGWISYERGLKPRIDFKAALGDKKIKIFPKECREFWLKDSMHFIRVKDSFTVKVALQNLLVTDDFLEVLEEGNVNLYRHYSISGSANPNGGLPVNWLNLVIKKDNDYHGLHPNLKKRRKYLEEVLNNDTGLIDLLCQENDSDVITAIHNYNSK